MRTLESGTGYRFFTGYKPGGKAVYADSVTMECPETEHVLECVELINEMMLANNVVQINAFRSVTTGSLVHIQDQWLLPCDNEGKLTEEAMEVLLYNTVWHFGNKL
jgi:hypothetical protein